MMHSSTGGACTVAVVVPCYKVKDHILGVLADIGPEVDLIYCIDDCCPVNSGEYIRENTTDSRVSVIRHEVNKGVGGAVLTGYSHAIAGGADVIVKIDGDGQMDPALLPAFVYPILQGESDYTKGNRFWDLGEIRQMPFVRRIGNLGLSFMAKLSSGYWNIFDPTNGYTAIHSAVAKELPFESISNRYFFETDMLFRLNVVRAVIVDIPMHARYADEQSNLRISEILPEFMFKHVRNFSKRIVYNYYLRDLSVASLELAAGASLIGFGLVFGGWNWFQAVKDQVATPVGTIMVATVALVTGIQFMLAFLGYDIASVPQRPISGLLRRTLLHRSRP